LNDQVRDTVLHYLADCSLADRQIHNLCNLVQDEGKDVCQVILHVLTHVDYEVDAAENCWLEILSHHKELSRLVGRPVSLQTAICDYFCYVRKTLKAPKIVDIEAFEETLQDLSNDYLTGLSNRKEFDAHLQQEFAKAERRGRPLTLLIFDLDDFKKINDNFGHQTGDLVLKNISAIIAHEKRLEDTAARYGGEEFALILPDTNKLEALVLAERIRVQVESAVIALGNENINITISGGIASFPIDTVEKETLVSYADHALYTAKRIGKNMVSLYQAEKRRYLRLDLHRDFKVNLSPDQNNGEDNLVNLRSKNICLGGILFESKTLFQLGSLLEIVLELEDSTAPLVIRSEVARVEKTGPTSYDIGVSFLAMEGNCLHFLSRYICRHLEQLGQLCSSTRHVLDRTATYAA